MADPTQPLRDKIKQGFNSIIPANSPLAQSGSSAAVPQPQDVAIQENPVTQATETALPEEIVTNPAQQRQVAAVESPTSSIAAPSSLDLAQNMIQSGVAQGQTASRDAISATDMAMSELEKKESELQARREAAMKDAELKIKQTEEEEKAFKPDNRSVWAKSSSGQKVALLVGGFLSSLSNNSAAAFRDSIDKSIERDNALEQQELERIRSRGQIARTELEKLTQRFGNEEAALLARSNQKLQSIGNRLQILSQSSQSKIVGANAIAGLEQIKSAQLANNAKIMEIMSKNAASKIEGYEGRKLSEKEATAAIEVKTSRDKAKQAISQLTSNLSGAKVPLSEAKATFAKNRDILVFDLAKVLSGGKPSDVELAKAEEIVPSEWSPSAQKELNALNKKIDQDFGIFMKNLGQKPIGSEIGRTK